MNLRDGVVDANGGAAVREMARSLGIDERDARSAADQLLPALARGLRRNASQSGGIDSLMRAIQTGNHGGYLEKPETLGQPQAIADGNAILGHIFGSKDVSRNVAGRASAQTGLDSGILKKMLPMLAAAAMGSLGQQASGGGQLAGLGAALGGGGGRSGDSPALSLLEGFLDADRDGNVLDDVLGLAQKFF